MVAMERDQHDTLYTLMRRWGASDEQAVDMLDGATFGPGLVGIQTQRSSFGPAVGIPIDTDVDGELGELLAWRAELDEDEYLEQWDTDPEPRWRVMLSAHSPPALARLTIKIRRPRELERRFLFDVEKLAPLLAEIQRPGASVWLVPLTVVLEQQARARDALGSLYDAITRSLLLGLSPGTAHEPRPGAHARRLQRRTPRRPQPRSAARAGPRSQA